MFFDDRDPPLTETLLGDLPQAGFPGQAAAPTEAMVRQESMLINEVCLILAEKRTALSVMRTGLAVLVLPLSVASVLIAISRYYDPGRVIWLLGPLLGLSLLLAVFGLYLILYAWRRSRNLESINRGLKRQNPRLGKLCDLVEGTRAPLEAPAAQGDNP